MVKTGRGSRAAARSEAPAALALCAIVAACDDPDGPPGQTYYEREIEPILEASCSGTTGGCHRADPDDPFAYAAGNLDVTSFENVQKRRDLLEPQGPYPVPPFLLKAVGRSDDLGFAYGDDFYPLEVPHGGGSILEVGSDAYLRILDWLESGATETGRPPPAEAEVGALPCVPEIPADVDVPEVPEGDALETFEAEVMPRLASCSAGDCHGSAQSAFFLTCGDDDDQIAANFASARAFVADPPENSPLLREPLAPEQGGKSHAGGVHFESPDDDDYREVAAWAEEVGPVDLGADDPGLEFFADYVQPALTAHGCEFAGCHSPQSTNDFSLRGGSQGYFSPAVIERNYEELRDEFMALEVPDARQSRAVAKGLAPSSGGIAHRGGAVLQPRGSDEADPEACPEEIEPGETSAFCVIQRWLEIERDALLGDGAVTPMGEGDAIPLVYVERAPEHVADPLEFDTYQPGSDLLVADATLGAGGAIAEVGEPRSLLDGCEGAEDRGAVDVSGPDVRRDGETVAFAMRLAEDEPRQLYTVSVEGEDCEQVTADEGEVDGILIHNFDPAWSPDGAWIVYASTRGTAEGDPEPSLSRRRLLPQSSIFRVRADGSDREQMTYLTNSEISPAFKQNGRVIMTTEKVSSELYQLAGRRLNWDLTDYHPLLAQRAESPMGDPEDPDEMFPSVDYAQATEIRHGLDGNFLLVLSDPGARGGAGTLATFNRSIGTFEAGRDDPGFVKAMRIPDRDATGRAGEDTRGAYRSPASLPDGRILASYTDFEGDLAEAESLDFDLVAVDPRTGEREAVLASSGAALVEAAVAIARPVREPFENRRQILFGGGVDPELAGGEDWGVMHIPDVPLTFTLLNANLRRGRPVSLFDDDARYLGAYREGPAPPGTDAPNAGEIYEDREFLGRAPLREDGSIMFRAPAGEGVVLELQDADGAPLETMLEEHQLGPGETIHFGVPRDLFDPVCGTCHGSISGEELDVGVSPEAPTRAARSQARDEGPVDLEP